MKFPEIALINFGNTVKKQAKKNKSIIYGARAIKQQIGFFARGTFDYDVLSRQPKKSAKQLERTLDKQSGGDYFYHQPSQFHKGTHKVYYKGNDRKKGTKDDVGIADFTTMKKLNTIKVRGIRYSHVSESIKDKRKSLADKQFAFRHEKDRDDLNRIKAYKKIKKYKLRLY